MLWILILVLAVAVWTTTSVAVVQQLCGAVIWLYAVVGFCLLLLKILHCLA